MRNKFKSRCLSCFIILSLALAGLYSLACKRNLKANESADVQSITDQVPTIEIVFSTIIKRSLTSVSPSDICAIRVAKDQVLKLAVKNPQAILGSLLDKSYYIELADSEANFPSVSLAAAETQVFAQGEEAEGAFVEGGEGLGLANQTPFSSHGNVSQPCALRAGYISMNHVLLGTETDQTPATVKAVDFGFPASKKPPPLIFTLIEKFLKGHDRFLDGGTRYSLVGAASRPGSKADCSGSILWALNHAGIANNNSIWPLVSDKENYVKCNPNSDCRPGDIIGRYLTTHPRNHWYLIQSSPSGNCRAVDTLISDVSSDKRGKPYFKGPIPNNLRNNVITYCARPKAMVF